MTPPLLLFGARTPSGAALIARVEPQRLTAVGRQRPPQLPAAARFLPCNLADRGAQSALDGLSGPGGPNGREPAPCWLVSFAPIWELAPWLAQQRACGAPWLARLGGVVACSSSSSVTKRFAANGFDRQLVARLRGAEQSLQATAAALGVPCRILAPTLIYGSAGGLHDRNLSVLAGLMRRLPLLPLPSPSGLRQPIHCSQLAAVALALVEQGAGGAGGSDAESPWPPTEPLLLGGDEALSYAVMLERLRAALPPGDPARRCRLLPLPAPLLQLLAAPLLLASPKTFEAVQRMGADLAGFTPAHRLTGTAPLPFPVPSAGSPAAAPTALPPP